MPGRRQTSGLTLFPGECDSGSRGKVRDRKREGLDARACSSAAVLLSPADHLEEIPQIVLKGGSEVSTKLLGVANIGEKKNQERLSARENC